MSTFSMMFGRWAIRMTVVPAALSDADGVGQCFLALAVEVGVRLVQDEERGVAVEGAGQSDPLALPA